MSKKSNEGILYLLLAIAVAALIAWIWSKSSKAVTFANLQARTRAASETIPVQTAPVSDVLIAPADMSADLSQAPLG